MSNANIQSSTTMTFLFTDIEGSTRQWEESAAMCERVEQHFAVLRGAVDDAGGEVFATMGDGVAAAFMSADAAVQAAVAAQLAMPAAAVSVRMGLHTGEVERIGDDFRGRPVNRAARIMAAGHGGQILLSDVTAALVRTGPSRVELTDLGSHRLRDLIEPERMWQLVDSRLEQRFPAVRGLDSYSTNLPGQRSSLVGRDREVRRVVDLVSANRIVTLTGVGGVGKTRLVVQAAADMLCEFSTVWFVELASVTDPDDVADAIALTIGARAVTDPLAAAASLLAGERTLLVVDNCEHVVDAAADVIDALLESCPRLHVVTTSREALGIDGEHVVAVKSLDPATTAMELFRQRAEAAGADVRMMDTAAIEHVCQRLDGIPLAIELAAARAATLGLATVVDALDDRFSLLSGGRRRAIDRHGTMRATIDWSYRLLVADEQRMFQWLSVFSNGFELDAARFVAAALGIDEITATERVASLVHKSMLTAESHPFGVRYRMLETMRAFAQEQVDACGDRAPASFVHAEWVASIAGASTADPCVAVVERNSIRLEREVDNWREALIYSLRQRNADLAGRLCGPPAAFFLLGRHDLADVIEPLVEICDADAHARRSVVCALLVASAGATDADRLQSWADTVEALDRDHRDGPSGVGGLMRWLALAWRGEIIESVDVCVQASRDHRLPESSREMFLGIAILDRFSLTGATTDPDGLIPRALAVADRSDVALTRVSSLLGAAWGLADTDPATALQLVQRALNDIGNVPPLTRLTLPGSASRLLARLDPCIAARGLLDQLQTSASRRTFIDYIPVFYASALLHQVGHPAAGVVLASLTASPIAPYLSMMDFVDLARRAATTNSLCSLGEVEDCVRAALAEIGLIELEAAACASHDRG